MLKRALILVAPLLVAGCALPLPVRVASWAIDGVSYMTTRKSITDHGISLVMERDCAVWRMVTDRRVCDETAPDVVVASSGAESEESAEEDLSTLAEFETSAGIPGAPLADEDDGWEITDEDVLAFADFMTSAGSADEHEQTGETDQARYFIARQAVNMRNRPTAKSLVLKVLLGNQKVRFIDKTDGWYLVESRDGGQGQQQKGWVDGGYLKLKG